MDKPSFGSTKKNTTASIPLVPGNSKLGPYEIIEEIGEGGMGKVYKAYHRQLDRVFAIKVLRPTSQTSDRDRNRFLTEAQLTAKLHHPNIVAVRDVGSENGRDYLVMDFIAGESLQALLRQSKLTPRKALELMHEVALAVDYAHQNGIVHRDLKPGNIMIESGTGKPLVMDFGLAKNLKMSKDITRSGEVLGTPKYMPPEQAEGRARSVSPRSDVYALGAILYEMLSGYTVVDGATPFNIIYNIIHQDTIPLRKRNPNLAVDLENICRKALEKNPEHRYPSAQKFADDIARFLAGEAIWARSASVWYYARKKAYHYRIAICIAAGVLVLSSISGFAIWNAAQSKATKVINEQRMLEKKREQENKKRQQEELLQLEQLMAEVPNISDDDFTANLSGQMQQEMETFRQLEQQAISRIIERIMPTFISTEGEQNEWHEHHNDRPNNNRPNQLGMIAETMIVSTKLQFEASISREMQQALLKDYIGKVCRLRGQHIVDRLATYLNSEHSGKRIVAINALGETANDQTTVEGKKFGAWLMEKLQGIDIEKKLQDTSAKKINITQQELAGVWKNSKNRANMRKEMGVYVVSRVMKHLESSRREWEDVELLVETLGKLRYRPALPVVENIRDRLRSEHPSVWLKMGVAYRWLCEEQKGQK